MNLVCSRSRSKLWILFPHFSFTAVFMYLCFLTSGFYITYQFIYPCYSAIYREFPIQAYTGPYRPPKKTQRDVIQDQDTKDLEVGMLVALDLERYRERPLVASVKEIAEEKVTVAWYGGAWTTKWSLAKKKNGRQWEEWLEEVHKDDIFCLILS